MIVLSMVEDKITKIGNMTIRYKITQIITLIGGILVNLICN